MPDPGKHVTPPSADEWTSRLQAVLAADGSRRDASEALEWLVSQGLDRPALPAAGHTLTRWRALAMVGGHDLSLAKLYEGHTDAIAILAEFDLADAAPTGTRWAVWAAEPPRGRARFIDEGHGLGWLEGNKLWCSGARGCTHALMTAWRDEDRQPQLVRLALDQTGIEVLPEQWKAVGMAASASLDLRFDGRVRAQAIGKPGEYLSRPGFWHGGAGIAACWWGAARSLAQALRRSSRDDPLARAALGRVDLGLETSAALLREAAAWIDANPRADARARALRARLGVERCATEILDQVGRTLGAGPFCRDADFARRAADLPVFLRQNHGDRDLAALGQLVVADEETGTWRL